MLFSFPKNERLCGAINVARLFNDGSAMVNFPLRTVFLFEKNENCEVKILISVPKKKFKRANRRNRIKRLIRESYRLNNSELKNALASRNLSLTLAIHYISAEMPDFEKISETVKQIFEELILKISENENITPNNQ